MLKNKVKRMFRMTTNVAVSGYWHSITPPNELTSITFPIKDISEIKLTVDGHDLLPYSSIKELKEIYDLIPWYDRMSFYEKSVTIKLDDLASERHIQISIYCEKKGNVNFFCLTK